MAVSGVSGYLSGAAEADRAVLFLERREDLAEAAYQGVRAESPIYSAATREAALARAAAAAEDAKDVDTSLGIAEDVKNFSDLGGAVGSVLSDL
jgi:non-canonical (house-cleaning) NTP pyrophosphatase